MSDNIHISGVGGDVIGVNIKGTGNIVGKDIRISGTIGVTSQQMAQIPDEYTKGLQAFSEIVNQQLRTHNIPPEQVVPLQESIDELAKEVEHVKPDEKINYTKKATIKAKLAALAEGLLKILPKAAEITAAFTPLAPFSKCIGEGIEEIVKSVQEG